MHRVYRRTRAAYICILSLHASSIAMATFSGVSHADATSTILEMGGGVLVRAIGEDGGTTHKNIKEEWL